MRPEEAIELLENLKVCKQAHTLFNIEKEAVDMAIKALKERPRWIPCSERLPEEYGFYLVTVESMMFDKKNYQTKFVWFDTRNKWDFREDVGHLVEKVVAWMPRPEPYKKEGEKNE